MAIKGKGTPQDDFMGRGWSFPPSFNAQTGSVDMTEREEDIRRSLQILLTTTAGERVMEPKYGCNLEEMVFQSLDTTTKTLLIDKIRTSILYFEPRIDAKRISIDPSNELEGQFVVEIEYVVRATNSRYNLVLPFYKTEATEIASLTGDRPFGA
jgi:phage baseplate assembly protein W